MFAAKEKYQDVLQHIHSFYTNGFHIKSVLTTIVNTLYFTYIR